MNDEAYSANSTLYSDIRFKTFQPLINSYPCTIEIVIKKNHHGTLGFSTWFPHLNFNTAVENSTLIFKTPIKDDINYLELNYPFEVKISSTAKHKIYEWNIKNLISVNNEIFAPQKIDIFPSILISPKTAIYNNVKGDFSNWNSLGKWFFQLTEKRDALDTTELKTIKKIVENVESKKEKIKLLYQYMQNKTRYVNVILGFGGFVPEKADVVSKKGYGDCKGLSNYMKAILKAVNIESFNTIIGTGTEKEIKFENFASLYQANHLILCVPLEKDSIWLECTSQNMPFNYLGSQSSNRKALIVNHKGGFIQKTPNYSINQNTTSSRVNIELTEENNAYFNFYRSFYNLEFDNIFELILANKKIQKDFLQKELTNNSIEIQNFEIQNKSVVIPEASLFAKGIIKTYSISSGSRKFFKLDFLQKKIDWIAIMNKRKLDLNVDFGFKTIDTLELKIPNNFQFETYPLTKKFSSIIGSYNYELVKKENTIIVIREFEINSGKYKPLFFREIETFFNNITQHESNDVIIKKVE
jgi:hypothetical protein